MLALISLAEGNFSFTFPYETKLLNKNRYVCSINGLMLLNRIVEKWDKIYGEISGICSIRKQNLPFRSWSQCKEIERGGV